ncbi:MAG: NADH-quinone oxidoreductase subunit L [Acidobacteriota bacterium]|nr:NADH-quinone oxidoreductase subunit L [Blastocatellia bacterium]MDQ3221445.1 NADH-quinone oxidoreductase subunit L [Acidobacteriota bacterium]MDQ3490540.1 NADH-quinone oxidoreductase subunit L [Acidobacteriota bacterium]
MTENNLLSLIIFAPLLGAVVNWLIGGRLKNETFSGIVACGSIALSTIVAFMVAFGIGTPHVGALFSPENKPVLDHLWTWIEVGGFRADFALGMDRLSGIYALFVTFVGLLIHIFATAYMHGDKGFYRFFAYLNLFMFSMLTLVLADNFLLMFVGWEGVGLCSYLLIGFYLKKDEAREAAKKAFVMNRIGDWGVLIGIFLIFALTGTISFYDKSVDGAQVASALNIFAQMTQEPFAWGAIFAGGITSVAVLLFIGATGKSAQIPLFTWLPDAMAGPTPVSALIHAATMVTAGVYMVVRCNAIFQNAPTAMFIVAMIGAATAIFAATIGLAQNDIKKVLAYSTVSQLGYMFLACGVGAFIAAIFHVMTHAFFKALLFLGSGSVIHGMHHEQDMRRMGNLRKYMPVTFITMMMGWLAICGIPIWAGFFSKDEILYKTFAAPNLPEPWNYILWTVGLITAVLTAVYMTRMMWMTFFGTERFQVALPEGDQGPDALSEPPALAGGLALASENDHNDDEEEHHHALPPNFKPHESPWTMTVPLIILALLSTVGGLVGVPYALSGGAIPNVFEETLEPVIAKIGHSGEPDVHSKNERSELKQLYAAAAAPKLESTAAEPHDAHSPEELRNERLLAGLSVLLALSGIAIGYALFGKTPLRKMPRILEEKWRIDEFYNGYIVDPITNLSREGLWKGFDVGFIDGIVNGIGHFTAELGNLARQVQIGFVRSYAAFIMLGAIVVIGYFIFYGFKLIG